jgi:hypothetical protein
MQTSNERVEQFKADAAELNLKAGNATRDGQLQAIGAVLMIVGVVLGFVSYAGATGAPTDGDVLEYVALAVASLGLVVFGGAVFLRYSLGKFLRLWLLRQMYEGQAHVDRVVDAVKQG